MATKIKFALALAAGVLWLSRTSIAGVITFDDLHPLFESPIPHDYQGLEWDHFGVINAVDSASDHRGPSGYLNAWISPPNVAFNDFGGVSRFHATTRFRLVSGYFTGAWNDDLMIKVAGLRDGVPVYSTTFSVTTYGPRLVTFNWNGVTEVTFTSYGGVANPDYWFYGGGEQFALEDLRVDPADQSPEPRTAALLAAGLVVLIARRQLNPVKA